MTDEPDKAGKPKRRPKSRRVGQALERGPYWELPDDTPRPKKLSGRPKKAVKKKGSAK